MHKRWFICLLVAAVTLLVSAWPVAAQGSTNAILNQDYVLAEGETLNQDLMVIKGNVRLESDSHVQGNVVVTGGSAYINGLVDGDVVVLGGDTELDAGAVVQGDLVAFGPLHRAEASQVLGNTVEGLEATQGLKYLPRMLSSLSEASRTQGEPASAGDTTGLGRLLGALTSLVLTLIVAALVVALMPDHFGRTTRAMRQSSLLCLGVGVLTFLLSAILVPVLVLICVGIPVAIVLALAVLLAGLVGWVGAGQIVGNWVLARLKVRATTIGEAIAGTLLLGLVSSIYGLGGVVAFLVVSWGLGAVVLTRFGAVIYPPLGTFEKGPASGGTPALPLQPAPPSAPEPPAPPSAPVAVRDTKPLDPALAARELDDKTS